MKKLYWIQPGDINSISGGYIYNKNIIDGLRSQSLDLELLNPGTDFPFPAKKSIEKCVKFFQNMKSSSIVVIDSLILGVIPDLIEEFAARHIIVGMIHLPLSLSPSFGNNEKKNFKEFEIKSFKYSKLIIVTSAYSKSEIIKMGINEDKIHVITPGINTIINHRNYPYNPKNLLCVSRISSSKGQLDLVKALESLQQFDWKLTICGAFNKQDDYYKEIRNRISISEMTNRIVFTGEIPGMEIEKYYKEADLLILTSYFETYSMVLQEAMAFKLPIISGNSGAVTQTSNVKVAKFYKPGDIAQLEKHLLSLLVKSNDYNKLANGYSKLNLKFESWSKKAEEFLHILKKYDIT